MSFINLCSFKISDYDDLNRLMNEPQNKLASGSVNKKWKEFIDWNLKNPLDTYWKIIDPETYEMIGYIGFDKALEKMTMKPIHSEINDHDYFLEIYIFDKFKRRGIGKEAFVQAVELLDDLDTTLRNIYASTYNFNTSAQRFFVDKIKMRISHYYEHISTIYKFTPIWDE